VRIDKLGWSVIGSVALHVGVLGWFWPHTPQRITYQPAAVIQAELIAYIPPAVQATAADSQSPPPVPKAPVPPATTPAPTMPEVPDIPPKSEPSPSSDPAGYLPIDAVDQPALPLTDWVIDTDVLPRNYTLRLVLQLWISAGGTLDHWEILGDTANPVLAQKALAHLSDTPIQPALKHQIAVPSFRQLEVVVTRD
jgi:hypothetical protein